MSKILELDFNKILVADDEFAPPDTAESAELKPRYFRNSLSSNGGLLSQDERKIVEEIFDPEDPAFLDVARSAFD